MRAKQALPYFAALLMLAWVLGSLARSGTTGTGILSNSYWLVYLVRLVPILATGAMVIMVAYLALSYREISDALGFGIARRKREARKQNSTLRLIVMLGFWGIAIGVLFWKCGGIFCNSSSNQTLSQTVENLVPGNTPNLPLTVLEGPASALAGFIGSGWFTISFLGLLVVSSVILARSIKVSMDETRAGEVLLERAREEATMAVQEALRILEMEEVADPRTRIMSCYEKMIRAAAGLGANVSVDKTARELEKGIRAAFQLKGPGIGELTRLFEEARYSLHRITEADSHQALLCLKEIQDELGAVVKVEN